MKNLIVTAIVGVLAFSSNSHAQGAAGGPKSSAEIETIAIAEAAKAEAAVESLKKTLEEMLSSDANKDLSPETKANIARELRNSSAQMGEMKRLIRQTIRTFSGERLIAAVSVGLGGEYSIRLPKVLRYPLAVGPEVIVGLAMGFMNKMTLPQVAPFSVMGGTSSTGFKQTGDSSKQGFVNFRFYLVPGGSMDLRQNPNFATDPVYVDLANLGGNYFKIIGAETRWRLFVNGTMKAEALGAWSKVPLAFDEVLPEVWVLSVSVGLGAQNTAISVQTGHQYLNFHEFVSR